MCTLRFTSCEFADCFMESKDPYAKGVCYGQESASCCTRHKIFTLDDLEVKIQVPSVDDLMLRTACCCCYCGIAFGPDRKSVV